LTYEKKYYYLCIIPVILSFNADLASAAALFIFFAAFGLWSTIEKRLTIKNYLLTTYTLPGLAGLIVAKQAISVFRNSDQLESARGIFSGTNFFANLTNFGKILTDSIFPQSLVVSLVILTIVIFFFTRAKKKNSYVVGFIYLTSFLFIVSYLFFSTNKGWKDWHTVFLPTLILISLFMLLSQIKKYVSIPILAVIFVSQLLIFIPRYIEYLKPSNDPGLLINQIQVIDWIYSKNEENGFNAYIYMTNSFFDYPYDYLFWWRGKNKYGHVPCHYEVYPKSHKYVYIPGGEFNYNTPTLGCDKLLFLIKEPVVDIDRYGKWMKNFANTKILETMEIGKITVEKRQYLQ